MPRPVESPCRQVCRLGPDGLCDGCGRTVDEIAAWSVLPPEERAAVMARLAGWIPRPSPPPAPR